MPAIIHTIFARPHRRQRERPAQRESDQSNLAGRMQAGRCRRQDAAQRQARHGEISCEGQGHRDGQKAAGPPKYRFIRRLCPPEQPGNAGGVG